MTVFLFRQLWVITGKQAHLTAIAVIVIILCSDSTVLSVEPDTLNESQWQIIGAPYVLANSDVGVAYGAGGGVSYYPKLYLLWWFGYSTKGLLSVGISSAEFNTPKWKFLDVSWASKMPAYQYTLHDNEPQIIGKADVTQYEFQLSALRKYGKLEIGPTGMIRIVSAENAEDGIGNSVPLDTFDRFGKADVELIGLRVRYNTASPIRPINGTIFEAALRGGRSDWERFDNPRFDMDAELRIGSAFAYSPRNRLFLRAWGMYQMEAPPPVQNFLGWERNHRGEPFMREWGRWFLSGRIQYHLTWIEHSPQPMKLLNELFSFIKPALIDYEIVPFYDIGAIGDPAYGWNKTRHAIGLGFHIVLPPDLVFRLDLAISPGGPMRFYIGAGETI